MTQTHPLEQMRLAAAERISDDPPQRTYAHETALRLLAWWNVLLIDVHGHTMHAGRATGPLKKVRELNESSQRAAETAEYLRSLCLDLNVAYPEMLSDPETWRSTDERAAVAARDACRQVGASLAYRAYRPIGRALAKTERARRKTALKEAYELLLSQGVTYAEIAQLAGSTAPKVRYVVEGRSVPDPDNPEPNPVKNRPRRPVLDKAEWDRYMVPVVEHRNWLRELKPIGYEPDALWEVSAEAYEELDTLRDARCWYMRRMREEAYRLNEIGQALGWESGDNAHMTRALKRAEVLIPDNPARTLLLVRKYGANYADLEDFDRWVRTADYDEGSTAREWVRYLTRVLNDNPKWKVRERARKEYTAKRKEHRAALDTAVAAAYDAGVPVNALAQVLGTSATMYNTLRRTRTND